MAMLVQSGTGITLVPGSLGNTVMDRIVTRPLSSAEQQMRVAAAYPEGDLEGGVAQFLRMAAAAA